MIEREPPMTGAEEGPDPGASESAGRRLGRSDLLAAVVLTAAPFLLFGLFVLLDSFIR